MEAGHKDGGQRSGGSVLTQNRSYNEQAEASCPGRSPQNCWRQEGWQLLEGSGAHTGTLELKLSYVKLTHGEYTQKYLYTYKSLAIYIIYYQLVTDRAYSL